MSRDESSVAVMGLKVLGSPKVATTSRPPGMPGSQGAIRGESGRGMLPDGVDEAVVDGAEAEDSFLFPQPEQMKAAIKPNTTDRHALNILMDISIPRHSPRS